MKTELYLQIPEPCHENWDRMSPSEKGRFCASCSKTVVDFSAMTDTQILNYFKTASGNTCGHFYTDQLQRSIHEPFIEKKKGWKWILTGIASLVAFGRLQAQKKTNKIISQGYTVIDIKKDPPVNIISPIAQVKIPAPSPISSEISSSQSAGSLRCTMVGGVTSLIIGDALVKGIVVDENDQPVSNAFLQPGGGLLNTLSDDKGHFRLNMLSKGLNPIRVSLFGYETTEVPVTEIKKMQGQELKIRIKSIPHVLPEVSVKGYGTQRSLFIDGGVRLLRNVETTDSIIQVLKKVVTDTLKIPTADLIKIYPNPVLRHQTVHVAIGNPGVYLIELMDEGGRVLNKLEQVSIIKRQAVDFVLPPATSAGMHYIRLVNMKTKKTAVTKLIVQ